MPATGYFSPKPGYSFGARRGTAPLGLNRSSGSGQMMDYLDAYFLPEYRRNAQARDPIQSAFMGQAMTPGALFGAANTAATGYARELFRPGGEVSSMISRARGGAIQSGFDPSAAAGPERGILQDATGRVADTFAQQASQLESQRFGALTGAFTETQGAGRDLLESMFTGIGSANQYNLAKNAQKGTPWWKQALAIGGGLALNAALPGVGKAISGAFMGGYAPGGR